jgi:hypothetical protein
MFVVWEGGASLTKVELGCYVNKGCVAFAIYINKVSSGKRRIMKIQIFHHDKNTIFKNLL